MADPAFWQDEEYQDRLVKLLVQDPLSLKRCAPLLKADDFKPLRGMRHARARWIVAERALDHYQRHQEPLGRLLRAEVLEYSDRSVLGERTAKELEDYLVHLAKVSANGPDAITEKIIRYKEGRLRSSVLQEMIELQASQQLTPEVWMEKTREALISSNGNGHYPISDYYLTSAERSETRKLYQQNGVSTVPSFFIDPLDAIVQGAGPGEIAMFLAPYGRGKSFALAWLAIMFTLQRLNVIFVTLEDPKKEVEERMDSLITAIPMSQLPEYPKSFQARFGRFQGKHDLLRSRLWIADGTEEHLTVDQIEGLGLQKRQEGFNPHVVIVDYDDEIAPSKAEKEKRFESSQKYSDMRRAAARNKWIWWTAGQTQRGTEKLKVISGDKAAEDIWKLRKVSLCISIGQGDWGPDSFFLWVAKKKFGKSHVGCHIVPDLDRGMFYDRDATWKAKRQYDTPVEQEDEDE